MLSWSEIIRLSVAFLLPLIPVTLLYLLFKDLNTFGLEGGLKYVVQAGGPIASYFAILNYLFSYIKSMSPVYKKAQSVKEIANLVVGDWDFEAKSFDSDRATGSCRISFDQNDIVIRGSFRQHGKATTDWESKYCRLKTDQFFYAYELRTTQGRYIGHTTIVLPERGSKYKKKLNVMEGTWVSSGAISTYGDIRFYR